MVINCVSKEFSDASRHLVAAERIFLSLPKASPEGGIPVHSPHHSLALDLPAYTTPMNPTERFHNRAENYHAHRPRYTAELLHLLQTECGLVASSVIADVGSGTGILTELFLGNGNRVYAVEPNAAMREFAERHLAKDPHFTSVAATAEETTLPDASVDFVVAGQAFHWFDRAKAGAEFMRILRPNRWIVLVWNERLTDNSAFAAAYEDLLLEHSVDYARVDPKQLSGDPAAVQEFFQQRAKAALYRHSMVLDFEQLSGLLCSASYTPPIGDARHGPMMEALRRVFLDHQTEGTVRLEYAMKVYYGRRFDPEPK